MATGYDRHRARMNALSLLGKGLARRANSKCELCEDRERSLTPFEVPPVPDEPQMDRAAILCSDCIKIVQGGPTRPEDWRCLESVMWSEIPPVQVLAVRLLTRFAVTGSQWCQDALDSVYLEPDIRAWADSTEFPQKQ